MKLALTQDMVFKMSRERAPVPGSKPMASAAFVGPNYLVYDDHRDAPPGFAVLMGKKATVYLVDKLVAGKKLKILVGLATGKKGDERPMPLAGARERAWTLIQASRKHGANPKAIADRVDASEQHHNQHRALDQDRQGQAIRLVGTQGEADCVRRSPLELELPRCRGQVGA